MNFFIDSDRTRRDEHAYIGHSSSRAICFLSEESLGFLPENVIFLAIMPICSPLEGGIPLFRGLNENP